MKKILFFTTLIFISVTVAAQKNDTKKSEQKYYDIFRCSDIYNSVWRELDINYVDTLNHEKLNDIAINSMLQSLDPYTVYIPEQQEEDLKAMTTGIYGGIGAVVQKHNDYVVISEPRYGLTAYKNGILAGDEIVSIDNENMKGKTVSYVSNRLKGIPGSEIKLKLRRHGENKLIEKTFHREAIHINSIEYYGVVADSIGYIALTDFTDQSYNEFKVALTALKDKNIKRLVIDLRNNGGGLVSEAVNIASMFLPKGTNIVSMRDKSAKNERKYKTPFVPIMPDIPLAIIVNENSASASEILAGAFQDLDRAVIVGARSFGKGLVQAIRQLPYGGYLKVTTAKYYLPSGRCIQSIDYDGSAGERPKTIPDSLTNKFKTVGGRTVRDKSGITPDVSVESEKGNYISYYLFTDNIIFDFATQYYYSHPKIENPNTFNITDDEYNSFISFVKSKNFTYKLESEKMLSQLRKLVETEGYLTQTDTLLKQLSPMLKADVERDLRDFRKDIQKLLESEIVKRYYYQRGYYEFFLRYDDWLAKAIESIK
ncbi:MAG: S41 family peptidase [Bacteroidota bacterium]